jgi:lipid II:glycine glycyltransferase (peptidoglycan interpeptide bridge formation enzyme)
MNASRLKPRTFMELREIKSKQEWEEFMQKCEQKTFLQSFSWGVFHESLGNKIWRFGVYEAEVLVSVALVVKILAKRGSFLLVPHGPVMKLSSSSSYQVHQVLLEKLKELAKEEKVDFIRISPIAKRTEENIGIFKKLGFRQGPLHYHPESSWKLNIEPAEDELLAGMRKSTRYLLKQAGQNKDLEIIKSSDPKDMKLFYDIHTPVAKLQKFVPFSLEYLTKEFEAFLPPPGRDSAGAGVDGNIALFFAKYKGEIIAGSFEIFYSGIGFYHHAALLPAYHKIPASHALQWEAIKEAKTRGCKVYDFWGYADPVKNPRHPYSGPTLFKQGFGGYVDEYVKTQDYIISPKYWINYIIEVFRKYKRGL